MPLLLQALPHTTARQTAGMTMALAWPLPALFTWLAAWLLWALLRAAPLPAALAFAAALALSALCALHLAQGAWRRLLVAAGFPALVLASGLAGPAAAWWWLLAALPLWLLYPAHAWRDAPFFPTPKRALAALPALLGPRQHLLDAGCGLGHGLHALRAAWPRARCSGIEYSRLLAVLARWRCRGWAQVQRGDMWAASWSGHDVIYLFQRPESMARAWAKARSEAEPGAVLVSLEFAVPGVVADAQASAPDGRPLWVYRIGGLATAAAADGAADGAAKQTAATSRSTGRRRRR